MNPISPRLTKAFSADSYNTKAASLQAKLHAYLSDTSAGVANPTVSPDEEYAYWLKRLKEEGGKGTPAPLDEVLDRTVHILHPHYMGHQVSPGLPSLGLADQLSGMLNAGMGVYEMGRPGTVMERIVIEQFADALGLPDTTDGFLTHGGTLANLTALLAARAARWPGKNEVWEDGQTDELRPCLLVNEQAHYCIDRAVRIMGWGAGGIRLVPSNDEFRIRVDQIDQAVEEALAEGYTPIAIVGSACTTSTGSFDDLAGLADAAQRHQLWFHVDAAHGGPFGLLPEYRQTILAGLERADSIVIDFHKSCCVPALCTGLFFRQGKDAYRTFRQRADYLLSFESEDEWYNLGRRTFECTKQMLSLRVYSLLYEYGFPFLHDYLRRVNELGQHLATLVNSRMDFDLAMPPDCNIVCFRYFPKTANLNAQQIDALNEMIRQQLVESEQFYIVSTKLRGRYYLRCTLTNPFTDEGHLEKMLDAVEEIGNEIQNLRPLAGLHFVTA
ncbi:MAG: pyridoxal-dependent decarboxylase [Bacteroidota bacterium]